MRAKIQGLPAINAKFSMRTYHMLRKFTSISGGASGWASGGLRGRIKPTAEEYFKFLSILCLRCLFLPEKGAN